MIPLEASRRVLRLSYNLRVWSSECSLDCGSQILDRLKREELWSSGVQARLMWANQPPR